MLSGLNPVTLVPLASGLSRAVGSGVVRSRALAAALQAASAQRLGALQSAAPRVRATLDRLAARLPSVRLNLEEIAIVRAVIAFYLSLILQLQAADDRPRRGARSSGRRLYVLSHLLFFPIRHSRTRIGVLLPPSLMAS